MRLWGCLGVATLSLGLVTGACSDNSTSNGSGGKPATGGTGGSTTGGSGGATGGTGGGTGGSSGGTGGASGGTGGATGGTGGIAGSASGGQAGSGGAAGADAATSLFSPSLTAMAPTVDCTVDGGADQVGGTFDASYDNSQNPSPVNGALSLVRFDFKAGSKSMNWTYKPTPQDSGDLAAGATAQVQYSPQGGTGLGSDNPCGYCNGTVTLTVQWTLNDANSTVLTDTFGPQNVACTF